MDDGTLGERIAGLKLRLGDGAERFAVLDRALRQEIEEVMAAHAAGESVVPEVTWPAIAADKVAPDLPARIRRHGCVIVRGVFPRSQATDWDAEIADYLRRNDADGRTRAGIGDARYAARWKGGQPQIYSVYWSPPQVQARQSASLAGVRAWLNTLWRWQGHFDPVQDLAYADRIRRRAPGDTTLALGPHIDGGTAGRWLGRGAAPYTQAFGDEAAAGFDPFDAAHRVDPPDDADANACGAFRTWQGWTALTSQGEGDGTLQVVPIASAIAWILLRPFAPDVPPGSLCGAETGSALWITAEWHAPLLRALVAIPRVEPGDTVWWHPDLIHAVEAAHAGAADSNVMYIPAAPDCPRNRSFLARQLPAFLDGSSPPDFPPDHLERHFAGRAGPDALTPPGRRQMGLDPLTRSAP